MLLFPEGDLIPDEPGQHGPKIVDQPADHMADGKILPLPDLGLPLANPVHLFQKWNEWPGGIIDHHITSVDDPEAGSGSSSCPLHISSGTDILPKRPDDRE